MVLQPLVFLRALADETRLRLVVLLHQETELCVCELTHALQTIQPKISRHLAILREQRILSDRRQGQWIYYRIHPDLPPWAMRALADIVEGAIGKKPYTTDHKTLNQMSDRPSGLCGA
jgi:ArsR family transcriptional regulator